MAKYKLLVLDLDGTLVNAQKEITQPTIEAIEAAQQSGVRVVLASGRPTYGIVPIARQLDIANYGGFIMSFNGGMILDAKSGDVVYQSTLPHEVIEPLYQMTQQAGVVISTYRDEFVICEKPDDKYMMKEIALTRMTPRRVEKFVESVDFAANKCLAVGDPQLLIPLQERVMERFSHCMNAFRSEPYFLELVPKGIDKALSLARLIEHLGIEQSQTVAVGDGYNDLSMIQFAGLGVAMANAQAEVREAADYITLSNQEDGVADLIHRYIL